MKRRLHASNNMTTRAKSPLSTVARQGMFPSRPFVVQSKKDNVQQPHLKTSLMQTENYGYHLHNMQTGGDSNATAVQAKKARESDNAEVIQMAGIPIIRRFQMAGIPMIRRFQMAGIPMIRRFQMAGSIRRQPITSSRQNLYPVRSQSGTINSPGQHGYKKNQQKPLSQTELAVAKNKLGHVPGTFSPPEKPKDYVGTYAGQFNKFKKTPSGNKVEVDHMTPDSLHQPLGQTRKISDGTKLSKRLPAAQLPYELHRRKNTTGRSKEADHQRAYLLHAHHGQVPFAGPMGTPKDHYAAAMEIDLRNTFDARTVFGQPNSLDPRKFAPSHKQGMPIPFEDMAWSADRMKEMIHESNRQERISSEGKTHLNSVVEEQLGTLKERYPKPES